MAKLKILGVVGSLRKGSYNLSAMRAAQKLVPPDVELEIFTLNGIPPFSEDDEQNPPPIVTEFKKKIREADAILFSTPEYNYSIPGVLKNAIDWASRPYGQSAWTGKPVAVMGASAGNLGAARAQYHLRQTFVFLDIYAVNQPEVMIGSAYEKFDKEGNLGDEKAKELIAKLLQNLADWTRRLGHKN
jgi:chromate reductase, NAD(P)H dehydrogenase (quinone)